jgi:hypothetical protein
MAEGDERSGLSGREDGAKVAEEERDGIVILAVSIQRAGNERGMRIYFNSRSIEEIKEECGDDFFLFNGKTLLAFIDPSQDIITLIPLKGIYKNYLNA